MDTGEWSALLDTVDKTDIPMKFVRGVDISYKDPIDGRDADHVDLHDLREKGWNNKMINDLVDAWLDHEINNIKTINFIIDIDHIAKVAQLHTDTYLLETQ